MKIWTANWGWEHNNRDIQNTLVIVLSAMAIMQVILWTGDNFCFISDGRNSFNCKLKKLINEQIIIFYSTSNALGSSEESVKIEHFKHHTWCVFPFHLIPSANIEFLLMKTDRERCKYALFVKIRCFYSLPLIHYQNLKKLSTLFFRYLPRKNRYMLGSLSWRS